MSGKGLFGYAESDMPKGGKMSVKRDLGHHESWANAILPADAEAGTLETDTNRRPLVGLAAAVFLILAILGARLFTLQISGGQHNLSLAEGNRIRQKIIRPPRGIIYDRNHKELVRNLASFDVTVVPLLLPKTAAERQQIYAKVARLVGLPAGEVGRRAESEGLDQIQPHLVVSGLDRDKALLLDQSTTDLPGFSLDVNPIREYLDNSQLSAFLGYTGRVSPQDLKNNNSYQPTDFIGKLGIEKEYEDLLRGTNGSEQTEVDAAGRPIKVLASKPAVSGSNLELSIDPGLESKLTEAINNQLKASGSTRGSGVALNPKTGEILAAVSLPSYDNNLFSRGISGSDYSKLVKDPGQPLFNKVAGGTYPSGSIIKPITGSAVLDEHVVTTQTTIDDKGSLQIPNVYNPSITYTFKGWEPGGLGPVNIYRAISMSSDIYFYTVAGGYRDFVGLGVNKLTAWYQKFGLGQRTGVDLPDETAGRVPTPEWKQKVSGQSWVTGDTYNISVGQGDILVSPLQMAVATAAIANGGNLIKPHFLKAVLDARGNVVRQAQPEIQRSSLATPATLDIIRQAMRQTVTQGTACCVMEQQVPVHVAGKTGTAETDPGGNRKPHAWFEAFAPYEDPQIAIVVLIENSGEGAEYAVPAVRETLAWYFSQPH